MTWKQRINNAKKRGGFTLDSKERAEDWRLCAVGEKLNLTKEDRVAPEVRKVRRHPKASKLLQLGLDFEDAVATHDVKRAERIYEDIQSL